jgi:predicted Zn-dependent peptidase
MSARLHRLPSGVRVVCDPSREHQTFALSLVVDGGSRWEDEGQAGWSHLLEHMVFKGAGGRDARALVEDIESVGGSINAATGFERTSYQVRALRGSVPLAVEVACDLVLRPTLDAEELEREKNVIAQELAEADDAPDDKVFDLAQGQAFADQPLGRPILGTTPSVGAATRDAVSDWRRLLYSPDRIVVSAAGAVDEDELLACVERAFAGLEPAGPVERPTPAVFTGGKVSETRKLEQAHFVLLLPGATVGGEDYYAGRVFAEALGGGMASRLFQEAREKRGLAYAIDAYAENYADVGLTGVYAGANAADGAALLRVVAEQVRDLAERPGEAEVARAKVQMKSGLFMGRESLLSRAEQAAAQVLLFDRLYGPDELAEEIDAVTVEDVRRFGEGVLAPGKAAVAVLGPKRATAAAPAFARALFG